MKTKQLVTNNEAPDEMYAPINQILVIATMKAIFSNYLYLTVPCVCLQCVVGQFLLNILTYL